VCGFDSMIKAGYATPSVGARARSASGHTPSSTEPRPHQPVAWGDQQLATGHQPTRQYPI
jgi:hypothetical protein